MMAGTTVVTKTADAIKTKVAAVLGISTAWQGHQRIDDGLLEDNIRALNAEQQGYFWFWFDERTYGPQTQTGEIAFRAQLGVRMDKDVSTDMTLAYDFAERIGAAMAKESNFVTAGSRPSRITWNPLVPGAKPMEDNICYFEYLMRYTVGPICDAGN